MNYTRQVQECDSLDKFPKTGSDDYVYIDRATKKIYTWANGKYTEMIFDSVEPSRPSGSSSNTELELRAQIAKAEKDKQDAQTALGIIAAANRRVGYAAMLLFVMWLNGFRYVETKWEMFFSLFGYTVYLSLIRTVDWFSNVFTGFFAALIEMMQRVGGPGI